MLLWLHGRFPCPRVMSWLVAGGQLVLGTEALPGVTVDDWSASPGEVIALLARTLRQLHLLPIDGCPLDHRWPKRLEQASSNVAAGLVDEDDFDKANAGRTAVDILDELQRLPPPRSPIAVTHGDFCFENIVVNEGKLSGLIDWGRGGLGNRANDLALAARSIEGDFGAPSVEQFLKAYGATDDDCADLYAFRLLDELF